MSTDATTLPGVVLLGGEGRRFGGAKSDAVLPDGVRLLDRARAALGPACGPLFAAGATAAMGDLEPLPDAEPGRGPIGGLVAALERTRALGAPGVVVLAVDLPRMNAAGILTLLARWRAGADPASRVVVAAEDGGAQPLAAVWGVDALPVLRGALDAGRLRVRDALGELSGHGVELDAVHAAVLEVACGHRDPLLNVNRPEDALAAIVDPVCPPIVAVQGWKNSGKTTLAAALVRELSTRGLAVAAMKRGHAFDLDTAGTDSHRLAEAGAARLVLASPDRISVLGASPPALGTGAAALATDALRGADVVVAEGWKSDDVPAIEVRRDAARDHRPIADAARRDRRLALVSNRPEDAAEGALDPDHADTVPHLADLVVRRLHVAPGRVTAGVDA